MDGDYDDDDDFWETGVSQQLKRNNSCVSAGNTCRRLDGGGDADAGAVDGGTGLGGDGGDGGGGISYSGGDGGGGVGSSGGGSIADDTSGGGGISMETTVATVHEQSSGIAFQRKAKLRKSVMFSDDTWSIRSPMGRHSPARHSGVEEEGVDTEMVASGWAAVTTATTTSTTAVTPSPVNLSGTGRKKREIMTGKAIRASSDFDGGSSSGGGGDSGGVSNSGTSGTSIFSSSSCGSSHSISRSNSSCSSSSSSSSNYSSGSSSSSGSSTCRRSNGSSDSGGGGDDGSDDDDNDDDNDEDNDDNDVGDGDGGDSDVRELISELQRLHQQQQLPRRKKTTSKQEEEEEEEEEGEDEGMMSKSSRSNNSCRSSRQMRRRHSSQSGGQQLEPMLTVDSLLVDHYGQLVKLCLEEIEVDDEASRRHIHARQMEQLYSTYIAVGNRQLALTPVALYPHGWPQYVTRRLFYPPPSSATPSMVQWECRKRGGSGSSTAAFSTTRSRSFGENGIRPERMNQRLLNGTRRVQNNRKMFRAKTTINPKKSSVIPSFTSSSSKGIFDRQENIPTAPPPTAPAAMPVPSTVSKKKLSGPSSASSSGRGSFVRQKKLPLKTASEENAASQTYRSVDNCFRPNDSNPHILKWLQKKDKNLSQQKREMKVRKKLEIENRKIDAAFKADRQLRSSAAFEEWMHRKANEKKFLFGSSTEKSSTDLSQEPKQSPKPTCGFPFMSKGQYECEGDNDAGVQEQKLSASQKSPGFAKTGRSLSDKTEEFVNETPEVNVLKMTNLQNWQTRNSVSNFTSSQAETGTDVPLEHKKSNLISRQPDEDNGRNQGKEQSFYGKPESRSSSPPTPLPLVMKKSTTRPKTAHGRRSRCSAVTDRNKCLVSPQPMPFPSL